MVTVTPDQVGSHHNKAFYLENILTRTRSPIFSSRSPFFTEPASDRLDTDSELERVRFEAGLVAFLVVALASGAVAGADAGAVAGADAGEATGAAVVGGVGDAGAVVVPLASPSVLESLEGRVKMPLKGSD